MDIAKPGRENVTEIVPAGEGTIDGASILERPADRAVAGRRAAARRACSIWPASRSAKSKLPGIGTVAGFGGDQDDNETFYIFTSYNTPTDIYRYDVPTGESELVRRPNVQFDPDEFAVEQVFYKSKDGTRVPMMLALPQGPATRNKPQPTLLYGYGGFSISMTPSFSARLRRLDGTRRRRGRRQPPRRRRIWRRLAPRPARISRSKTSSTTSSPRPNGSSPRGRTTRDQLAIMGGSNGGLLVGAVMVQRPELFGACIPIVGVMDMLRFHQFTAGQFWRDEFGSVEDADEFKNLLRLFALPQYQGRRAIPGDADHDRRHRRPRRADAQLQIRRRAAAGPGRRRADPAADRNPRRPRRRHAGLEADRKRRRQMGVFGEESEDGRAGEGGRSAAGRIVI